jgi:rSAM/selenodomain-associated transferase 1
MTKNNSQNNKGNSLIIFLKHPKNGQVKTRLAKTTSQDFATKFYKLCAEHIIQTIKEISDINRFAFYSNQSEKKEVESWLGSDLLFMPQEGDDLGSRMKNAFNSVFSLGSEKVIIIGTDIPELSKELLAEAFDHLNKNEVVLGPSKDGGYYLLGIKKIYPELFDGIEYSTSSVLSDTIKRIKDLGLSYHLLPVLSDVDTEEDLIEWMGRSSNTSLKKEINLAYKPIREKQL